MQSLRVCDFIRILIRSASLMLKDVLVGGILRPFWGIKLFINYYLLSLPLESLKTIVMLCPHIIFIISSIESLDCWMLHQGNVGRLCLVLRSSALLFPPIFSHIELYRERNPTLKLSQTQHRDYIKYFISPSENRTQNRRAYVTLHHHHIFII